MQIPPTSPVGSGGGLVVGSGGGAGAGGGGGGGGAGSLQQMQQTQKILQSPLKTSLSSLPQPTSPTPPSVSAANTAGVTSSSDRFGLLGLRRIIRKTDPDLNVLALGINLTTLGLDLNSPDCLYASFSSPFAEGPSRREPDYYLPACYYTQPPMQPAAMKMPMFSEETLLYIFYSMPKDALQLHAAAELHARDWRYHKDHKLWFTRAAAPPTGPWQGKGEFDHAATAAAGGAGSGAGSGYFYFDPNTWEKMQIKDTSVLPYEQLDHGTVAVVSSSMLGSQRSVTTILT